MSENLEAVAARDCNKRDARAGYNLSPWANACVSFITENGQGRRGPL
jgi:hypothetical protein